MDVDCRTPSVTVCSLDIPTMFIAYDKYEEVVNEETNIGEITQEVVRMNDNGVETDIATVF